MSRPMMIESADGVPLLEPKLLTAVVMQATLLLNEYPEVGQQMFYVGEALEDALESDDPDVLLMAQVQFFAYLSMALMQAVRQTQNLANRAANSLLTDAGMN